MALLPNAHQRSYAQLVQRSVSEEGLVNGIWNSILNTWFPTQSLEWTINPEYRTNVGPIDLLVIRNVITQYEDQSIRIRPAFAVIFEGKRRDGENYERIYTQLVNYARTSKAAFIYLIGARGGTCRFWKFAKLKADDAEKMYVDRWGNVNFAYRGVFHEYDIVTQQVQITSMLRWIIDNPPPPPRH